MKMQTMFSQVVIEDMAGLKSVLGEQFGRYVRHGRNAAQELVALVMEGDNPLSRRIAPFLSISA